MKQNALVTGGLGFIGSHIVDLLVAKGMNVTVVDNLSTGRNQNRNPLAIYHIEDLSDTASNLLHEQDYVFHCAALPRIQPSFDEPKEHEIANVMVTLDLILKLKNSVRLKKLVVSSSSAAYGNPDQFPTNESCPINPLSPYALQKYAAEQYALLLGHRYGLPVIALRYFNVYGPRSFNPVNPYNAYSSVIGIFANQASNGGPISITGDGSQTRDFIHVRDVAKANLLAASTSFVNRIYNVGTGRHISILDVAKLFDVPYHFITKRDGEAMTTWADITAISKDLDWTPEVDLKLGIREAIEIIKTDVHPVTANV